MSDDLVKQSIAELQDLVRCRCHEAYKGRRLHDPDCHCDTAEAVKVVADRIDELEAQLRELFMENLVSLGQAQDAHQAQLEAEAKLAKALEIGNKMAKSIERNYYLPGVAGEWKKMTGDKDG